MCIKLLKWYSYAWEITIISISKYYYAIILLYDFFYLNTLSYYHSYHILS